MSEQWPPPSPDADSWAPAPVAAAPAGPSKSKMWGAGLGTAVAAGLLALLLWGLAADRTPAIIAADDGATTAPEPGTVDPGVVPVPEPEVAEEESGSDDSEAEQGEAEESAPLDSTEDFDAVIDELIEFVERERELEFKEPVVVQALDDDAFIERYNSLVDEGISEDAELIAHYTGIYQALGILNPGVTLEEATYAFGAAGVLGYYDPETQELVVRGGEMTVLLKTIIAHELVHAIDDQWFDLDRPEYDDAEDEIGFGFRAVVEGNARRIENIYRDTLSPAEQVQLTADELALSAGVGVDFSKITFEYISLQLAPYEAGETLANRLDREGGEAKVNEALETPPRTSEQVLNPDAYLSGDDPLVLIDPPPADGDVQEAGVFGQALWQILFEQTSGESDAVEATQGWEGDWFVSWQDGDTSCVRVDTEFDDSGDVDKFVRALENFIRVKVPSGGEAEKLSDNSARLTACN